ncbi:MAG: DUF2169 domain-containing protein [Opitutaceae bacterium]|nr:DUF2169 domain-containing protein [Opitutaceae bacterium]
MNITNNTPFSHTLFTFTNKKRQYHRVCVVKAAFRWSEDGRTVTSIPEDADGQWGRILDTDSFYGDGPLASTRDEADLAPFKPRTDVYLVDPIAHAPGGVARAAWECSVTVGEIKHALRVTGPRQWREGILGASLTSPEPALQVPIRYELAFGGVARSGTTTEVLESNPVGTGFCGSRGLPGGWGGINAPQVEAIGDPINRLGKVYKSAGFTPIGRAWEARRLLGGTYDDKWLKEQWPFHALDYEPEAEQSGPPELRLPTYAKGGELVVLENLTPDGTTRFQIPELGTMLGVMDGSKTKIPVCIFNLDTIRIIPHHSIFSLVFRASFFQPPTANGMCIDLF